MVVYIPNPLRCSCLENPVDGGARWAAVYGVAWGRTRLKRLSSSNGVYSNSILQSLLGTKGTGSQQPATEDDFYLLLLHSGKDSGENVRSSIDAECITDSGRWRGAESPPRCLLWWPLIGCCPAGPAHGEWRWVRWWFTAQSRSPGQIASLQVSSPSSWT